MKNVELAKLLYEMKPGDPPSLHKGENWYTMWNSFTVEEAWQEAEKTGLIPDWEHDWDALKQLLFAVMKEYAFTLSIDALEETFVVRFENYESTYIEKRFTLEEAILEAIFKALTYRTK